MVYFNTLDIDNGDKANLERILNKISQNKCCLDLKLKDSSNKGYHILITCDRKCDICRIVFDDQKRLEMDSLRQEKFRNTLFTEKEYFRGTINSLKDNRIFDCDRCKKYGVKNILKSRELTLEETIIKLKIGKIKIPIFATPQMVYLGFTYYECPECNWFKFVKNKR
jgi:hypothetical protein